MGGHLSIYIVFHSSIAGSAFFSLYSEGTSASLDAVLRSAYDAAARSPDLLLIQGVLGLLHGVDQLIQGGRGYLHSSARHTDQNQ